ncbi:MAG: hypothetical protein PUD55_02655 [Firmicutes bacterium]|nr:hypothetical protein [Bacillota bacterium]
MYSNLTSIDCSLVLYSLLAALFYLNDFKYAERNLAHQAQQKILNDMDHPIVFFDDVGKFVVKNSAADFLFRAEPDHNYTIEKYLLENNFDIALRNSLERKYFYINPSKNSTLRCDFHPLYGANQSLSGRNRFVTNFK